MCAVSAFPALYIGPVGAVVFLCGLVLGIVAVRSSDRQTRWMGVSAFVLLGVDVAIAVVGVLAFVADGPR